MSDDMLRPPREVIGRALHVAALSSDPKLPLLTFVQQARGNVVVVDHPETEWPKSAARSTKPTIFLVGDDPWPDGEAPGPEPWNLATHLRSWAAAVIVHGAAAQVEHYREAVLAAETVGRVALVETDSAQATAWAEFLRCPATLVIVPPPGLVHPARRALGSVH